MKKVSLILVLCICFSLFCSCEKEISESSNTMVKEPLSSVEKNESVFVSQEQSQVADNESFQNSTSDKQTEGELENKPESEGKEDSEVTSSKQEGVKPSSKPSVDLPHASSKKPQSVSSKPSSSRQESSSQAQTITSALISSEKSSTSKNSSSKTSSNSKVEYKEIKPIAENEYYGYLELQKTGTEAEKKAYQIFKEEIGKYNATINFNFDITKQELERAYNYYKDDYPQHFWCGNTLRFSGYDDRIETVELNNMICNGNVEQIKLLDAEMKSKTEKILKNINGSMTEFEREEYIHNYLVNNCRYYETDYSHTAYGAIVKGNAVCEGYSCAFQYLMRLAGVQCVNVKGTLDTSGRGTESHEWNIILLDGEYYHVDLTSDDPITTTQNGSVVDVIKFTYFNLSDDAIKTDHKITDNFYSVPKAKGKKYNYFNYYKLNFEELSVENFASAYAYAAKKGYERASVKIENLTEAKFGKFISENYYDIVLKANEILQKDKLKVGNSINYVVDENYDIVNIELNYV